MGEISPTLKVVHDSACSAAPTLKLPLNTIVEGTLTVGGVELSSPSANTWTDITPDAKFETVSQSPSNTPQYMVMGGIVYLRGGLQTSSANSYSYFRNEQVGTMPEGVRPRDTVVLSVSSTGTYPFRIHVGSSGSIHAQVGSDQQPDRLYFDGVTYSLA